MWKFFKSSSTDDLVKQLKNSILFAPDFPRRKRYTHAEWEGLHEAERNLAEQVGVVAINRAKNHAELLQAITELGDPKHAAAVPTLSELWADCALVPVRTAVGRSLEQIATPEARAALLALIEDADHFSVFMAVKSVFDEDHAKAFDRCAEYFVPDRVAKPGGAVIPNAILGTFAPSYFERGVTPGWTEKKAPQWLRDDQRWLHLCVSLRKDAVLGAVARQVLRYAEAAMVTEALRQAVAQEERRVIKTTTTGPGDLLARYLKGQHEEVWRELRSHECVGGDLLAEASAVADETMKRVAHNTRLVAERLAAQGWQPLYGELKSEPSDGDDEVMARIEEMTGAPVPLSLRAFWKRVGGVNFIWNYQSRKKMPNLGLDLDAEGLDPLCVSSAEEVADMFEEWEYQRENVDPELWDPVSIDLSPDYLHKANVSGGAAYAIEVPFLGVDPIFANEEHNLPFVDYLRLCFRWGGFPRLEYFEGRTDVQRFIDVMTKGFEPF